MGKNSGDHLICNCLGSFIDVLEEMLNIFCGEKGQCLNFKYRRAVHIIFETLIPEVLD